MSTPQLVIFFAVLIASFGWSLRLWGRREHWVVDYLSTGAMLAIASVAVATLVGSGNFGVVIYLLGSYAPHAYNLVIWPIFGLLVLRPRFGPISFLVVFAFVYGLDEIVWNSVAFVYFGGNAGMLGMLATEWQAFILVVIVGTGVCYLVARPQIKPNWSWLFFTLYLFVYTVVAGMPTYVDAPYVGDPYTWAWELMWQVAVWAVIYWTFWPPSEVPLLRGFQMPLRKGLVTP